MRVFHDDIRGPDCGVPTGVGVGPTLAASATSVLAKTQDHRRNSARVRTVYRVAPVYTGKSHGLAQVRNISDGGMRLRMALAVNLGDRVTLALSESQILEGTVVWEENQECGLKFDYPIDSFACLRATCEEARRPGARPPRIPVAKAVLARSESGMRAVKLQDISQSGMKIAHDGSLNSGMKVKITLPSGIERRGVVRWSGDGMAGIMLTETFTQRELSDVEIL